MREKCDRKGLPQTAQSALHDISRCHRHPHRLLFPRRYLPGHRFLKSQPDIRIVEEKDYIRNVKPNGYRSYHIILELQAPYEDVTGANPGRFYAEVQLRTIAMDSWASLEHQMKYKQDIKNPQLIVRELKRCADELASCDVSMQTIRNLIHAQE